ncbi:MAG TPA: hypothetical protein VM925_09675 [Labilithrix sp.]|jgi:hypothetical protein|nr:hypothetical protein [Labilithrix sp.]
MTVPTVSCTNCGKNFTTDDLRGTNCRYCGTLLAHHARAAQQVAVVNQMLADRNGNGIPDAYEGLVANAQANALNQAFGMGPPPYGSPMGPPMPGPHGYAPPAVHIHAANMHMQAATRTMSKVMLIVVVSIVLVALGIVGLAVAMMVLLR